MTGYVASLGKNVILLVVEYFDTSYKVGLHDNNGKVVLPEFMLVKLETNDF